MSGSILERVVRLPTAGGADDFWRADQPLGAGVGHLVTSNAQHLASENALRHLYTWGGWQEVCTDLPFSTVQEFDWNGFRLPGTLEPRELGGANDEGTLVLCSGPVRIKRHPNYTVWPRVEWRFRWYAPAGFDIGAFAVVTPWGELPSTRHPHDSATTAAVAYEDGALTVDLAALARVTVDPAAPDSTSEESGPVDLVSCWLGVWCTSDDKASPGRIAGVSCFLREPA